MITIGNARPEPMGRIVLTTDFSTACRMDTTSISLLRQLQEFGQEQAWERFVELYAPLVFHWVRQQGLNATDAAETVQEVLSTMVVRLPEFEYDPNKRFRGWLRTVAVNKARDFLRRQANQPASGLPDSVAKDLIADPLEPLGEAEYRGILIRRALQLMRAEFRENTWKACWLHVAEGRTAADVGQELGMTPNAVHVAKCRVMRRLREELAGLID